MEAIVEAVVEFAVEWAGRGCGSRASCYLQGFLYYWDGPAAIRERDQWMQRSG